MKGYTMLEKIGEGTYGSVFLGESSCGSLVAIKKTRLDVRVLLRSSVSLILLCSGVSLLKLAAL